MLEEKTTLAGPSHPGAGYSYPRDLARFVRGRWGDAPDLCGDVDLLPDAATLEDFFSGCYHASMLREEERPVTFRAILAAPTLFAPEGRPPEGLLRLEFSRSLPFHPSELRRLSVAADPHRTLIGVWRDGQGGLRIWGVIDSGVRWLRNVQGGRRAGPPLPPAPVIQLHAPGRIEVYKGYELVCKLQGGTLSGSRLDIFESKWLPAAFSGFRGEIAERHEVARKGAIELRGERWAPLEPTLTRRIAERLMKRVIAIVSDARHGGTIIFVPGERTRERSPADPFIDLRYRLADGEPRLFFPNLLVDILNRLAQLYGASGPDTLGPVGWREFEATTDDEIATLDEVLFEFAYLIAGLAAVDLPTGDSASGSRCDCDLSGRGGAIRKPERRARYLLGSRVNQPLAHLVDLLRTIADRKKATPARIALAWLLAQRPWIAPIPGTSKLSRLDENIGAVTVELTPEDLREIDSIASKITIQGARYPEALEKRTGL